MADPAQRHKLSDGGTGAFDLVVVRNTGKHLLTLRHRRMGDVDLKPGKQRTIPVGIALVNLGNPTARDSGKDRARTNEVNRVRRKWGFNKGFFSETAWFGVGTDGITGEKVGPFCPPIECFSLDGERMYFIHDDPLGTKNARDLSGIEAAGSDDRFVNAKIEDLQAQIRSLTDLISAKQEDEDNKDVPSSPIDPALDALGTDQATMDAAVAESQASQSDIQSQAERNEQREEIPSPASDEPAVKADAPATPKVGRGRGSDH